MWVTLLRVSPGWNPRSRCQPASARGQSCPRAHAGGCQNSVACGCRAVFPFLAGCQRGALLSCLKPLASWVFKPAVMPGSPPLTSDVSDLPSAASLLPPSRETSLLLIAQVIKEDPWGYARVISLSSSVSILNYICKDPLPWFTLTYSQVLETRV